MGVYRYRLSFKSIEINLVYPIISLKMRIFRWKNSVKGKFDTDIVLKISNKKYIPVN